MTDRPLPRLLAMTVAGSMFMAQLDSTIIATALPQMAQTFGVGAVDLSIGITVYLLAQAVFLPASNWITERLGARRVYAGAILLFTLASILCGISETLGQFVAARVLQGASAALMTPVGRIVLFRSTDRSELIRVMTIVSTPMLIAPTLGPPIGGFIVTYLSWRWVFFLNLPFGLLCFALILRIVPDLPDQIRRPFDRLGFFLNGAAISSLLYGLDRISAPQDDRTVPLACLAAALILGVAAIRHAMHTPHPLLSLRSLRFTSYRIAALGGGAWTRVPIQALPFLLPMMFQVGLGMTAFVSGLLLMMLNGGDLVFKPWVRSVLKRFGFRSALMAMSVISSIAILLSAGFGQATPLLLIAVGLLVIGVARSVLFTGISSLLYSEVPEEETGEATILWNVIQQTMNALAVSSTAILLHLSVAFHKDPINLPTLMDFRLALLIQALLGIPAFLSFARLARDAGSALSGHHPHDQSVSDE